MKVSHKVLPITVLNKIICAGGAAAVPSQKWAVKSFNSVGFSYLEASQLTPFVW